MGKHAVGGGLGEAQIQNIIWPLMRHCLL